MSPRSFVIVGVLFAVAGPAPAGMRSGTAVAAIPEPPCEPQFAPLGTGSSSARSNLPFWRTDEAGGWDGDGWLGWTYDGVALVPVTLVVRHWPKERDDDEDEVTVESIPRVTFAIRCIGVPTANIRSAGIVNHELQYDGPLRIGLGDRRYRLALEGSRKDPADAKVILTDGLRTQVLYSTDGFVDDPHFYVSWAGDLDGDRELDLVVNLSRKYSMHPYRLLLSSFKTEGDLVGEAATFETGC